MPDRDKPWLDNATPEEIAELAKWVEENHGVVLDMNKKCFVDPNTGQKCCDCCYAPRDDIGYYATFPRGNVYELGGADLCRDCHLPLAHAQQIGWWARKAKREGVASLSAYVLSELRKEGVL